LLLLNKHKVLIQKAVAVMADNNVIREMYDFREGMGTGYLFFRWPTGTTWEQLGPNWYQLGFFSEKIDIINCSLFLVRRRGLFGSFWPTGVVVLTDQGW